MRLVAGGKRVGVVTTEREVVGDANAVLAPPDRQRTYPFSHDAGDEEHPVVSIQLDLNEKAFDFEYGYVFGEYVWT